MKYQFTCLAVIAMCFATANAEEQLQRIAVSQSRSELLEQRMSQLISERESVLMQLSDQYKQCQPFERVALERSYSERQREYQLSLGELMVEYFELTGNTVERDKAVRQLAQMQADLDSATLPQPAPRAARSSEEVVR